MTQMTQMQEADGAQRDAQSYSVIGSAMAVHRELGGGFLEAVYQEALTVEFALRAIEYRREVPLTAHCRGHARNTSYRADFWCCDGLLLEMKAIQRLSIIEEAQVLNCLWASGLNKALLINSAAPRLEYKRLVLHLRESASSAVSSSLVDQDHRP